MIERIKLEHVVGCGQYHNDKFRLTIGEHSIEFPKDTPTVEMCHFIEKLTNYYTGSKDKYFRLIEDIDKLIYPKKDMM